MRVKLSLEKTRRGTWEKRMERIGGSVRMERQGTQQL